MEVQDLQLPILVYPPNQPLDSSRVRHSKKPQWHPYLCNMDVNPAGNILLTVNDLTGRIWNGCVYFYENLENMLKREHNKTYVATSSISCVKYITNDTVLVGENLPNLCLVTPQQDYEACSIIDLFIPDECILDMAVLNSQRFVTCTESSVSVWNIAGEAMQCDKAYPTYSDQRMTAITRLPCNDNCFVTTDTNGSVLIWDLRKDKPARLHYQNEFSQLSCVDVSARNKNMLAAGSEVGDIYLLDLRQPHDFIAKHVLDQDVPVRKLLFSTNDDEHFAACGDCTSMYVFNYKDNGGLRLVLKDEMHSGYVRDLLWMQDELVSCGFDGNILKRKPVV